jgi:hypothetical protein
MAASEGGLRVHATAGSGYNSGGNTMAFNIAPSEATNIFQGDVVKLVNDGTVVAMSAVGNTPVLGVFVGCEFTNSDGELVFSNKYTDTITAEGTVAHVLVNPYQLYTIQIANGDANTTLTQTAIGLNYDIEFNAGNSTTGVSGMCLDSGEAGIAGAANLRLVGLTNNDGTNDMAGTSSTTYTHGIVMIDPKISFWIDGPGL